MGPFLRYPTASGDMRLLNLPHAEAVMNEVFTDDCYRINEIPRESIVLDVGGFYGEFGILCYMERNCKVMIFEPSLETFKILEFNVELNRSSLRQSITDGDICQKWAAIGSATEMRKFTYREDHPAGSMFDVGGCDISCLTLSSQIALVSKMWGDSPICVKLDCEGAEKEIFESDQSWMDAIDLITMEWHNYDGDYYANFLEKKGFRVELEGGGPKPRPKWDKTIGGGLLFAKKF
jgi:FkbM family methyltransferase